MLLCKIIVQKYHSRHLWIRSTSTTKTYWQIQWVVISQMDNRCYPLIDQVRPDASTERKMCNLHIVEIGFRMNQLGKRESSITIKLTWSRFENTSAKKWVCLLSILSFQWRVFYSSWSVEPFFCMFLTLSCSFSNLNALTSCVLLLSLAARALLLLLKKKRFPTMKYLLLSKDKRRRET